MSEAWITATGTVNSEPVEIPSSTGFHAMFGMTWRPTIRGGTGDETQVAVSVSKDLAADVLDKVVRGDRITVVGRLGTYQGRLRLYGHCIGIDLRSIDPDRAELLADDSAA